MQSEYIQKHGRSLTEPSTPKQSSSRTDATSYVQPHLAGAYRFDDVGLPPHELGTITARFSQEAISAPGSLRRKRKQMGVPSTSPGAIEMLGQRRFSTVLWPSSMGSHVNRYQIEEANEGTRKRKRQSFIVDETGERIFDANYVGPITIDFLRFFCKVLKREEQIQNKRGSDTATTEKLVAEENSVETKRQDIIPETQRPLNTESGKDEFEDSLVLPDNSLDVLGTLRSTNHDPESRDISRNEKDNEAENFALDVRNNATKPAKKKSYLEKILAAKSIKDLEISNVLTAKESPVKNISQQAGPAKIQSPEPSSTVNTFIIPNEVTNFKFSDTSLSTGTELHSKYDGRSDGLNDILNDDQYTMRPDGEIGALNDTSINNLLTSSNKDSKNGPPHLSDKSLLNEELQKEIDDGRDEEDYSDEEKGFIDEGIFIDNPEHNEEPYMPNDIGSIEEDLRNISEADEVPSVSLPYPQNKKENPLSRVIDRESMIPMSIVKGLIKNLSTLALSLEQTSRNKRNRKPIRFDSNMYKYIQEKSTDFLQQVIMDLEAYTKHRTHDKGKSINIEDVMLYLNRIRLISTPDFTRTNIENISNIAYNFLPLELMISLNNSLEKKGFRQLSYRDSE